MNIKLLLLLVAGVLLLLSLPACSSNDSIVANAVVWERFVQDGNENCLFCHTGFDKAPLNHHCIFDANQNCLNCHTDMMVAQTNGITYENCLSCHTGTQLTIAEQCTVSASRECLKCHTDMLNGALTDWNCISCHAG